MKNGTDCTRAAFSVYVEKITNVIILINLQGSFRMILLIDQLK